MFGKLILRQKAPINKNLNIRHSAWDNSRPPWLTWAWGFQVSLIKMRSIGAYFNLNRNKMWQITKSDNK